MRYYQLRESDCRQLIAVEGASGYDLTDAKPKLQTFRDLARAASIAETTVDEIAARHINTAATYPVEEAIASNTIPIDVEEVWAAGVTYKISEEAREEESMMPEMYMNVYDANRPEIFFKATRSRTVGHSDDIGIRADSNWNVPEPELGLVLYEGEIVGFTVGNDVSSRTIEGENPLYLPQAKVYERCCAIGPCVSTDVADPHDLAIEMHIYRDGDIVYDGQTSTSELVRTCSELVETLSAHNSIPELAVLLTGTSLVPEEGFTLQEGDEVEIEIEEIGTLRNPTRTV